MDLPFIRAVPKVTFSQDNALPHIGGIVQTFHEAENVRLLSWPTRSTDMSPKENVCSMAAERLARLPASTVDELCHRVESAWVAVSVLV